MSAGVFYQMFQTYYDRAVQADKNGKLQEAKKMYLLAGESLLKVAQESSGETKAALLRRADKLILLSDMIEVPELSDKEGAEKGEGGLSRSKSSDQKTSVWKCAGKPNVKFDDIAGLREVKESIQRRVILPRQYAELYKMFRRNVKGGILLYGPPGTGKTMIAKAIATEVDADFYSIRCSDIVGKYYGESENNVKKLFEAARQSQAAVIFFDEFDALASQRNDDSETTNRLVTELLSQMDGFDDTEKQNDLLFLAATNRPWTLDSAFLRPPRLTEKIYVGLPDFEARSFLIKKELAEVPQVADLDLEFLAKNTEGYNAADIVEMCEVIKDQGIGRSIEKRNLSPLRQQDLQIALDKVHSSVQEVDIQMLKEWEASQRR